MIDRQHGRLSMACDNCGEVLDVTVEDAHGGFQELIEASREDGWSSRKYRDKWAHYCPDCRLPR